MNQGVYDRQRDLYYFTDVNTVQVFSRTSSSWKTAFQMPSTSGTKQLWGLALSPDDSLLAISDPGTSSIYVLDPDHPAAIKAFPVPATEPIPIFPCGVAITNDGQVFYLISEQGTGAEGLYHLDTSTGAITGNSSARAEDIANSAVLILVSEDGARLYENLNGVLTAVDTSTGKVFENLLVTQTGDYDMALSSDATTLAGDGYLVDTDLGLQAYTVENSREAVMNAVYGEKLSADGSLLISPLVGGLDLFDARTGVWLGRVALPVSLAPVYDSLVSDERSNILVGITGTGEDVAAIDLSSVPLPNPLPYPLLRATGNSGWVAAAPPLKGDSRAGIRFSPSCGIPGGRRETSPSALPPSASNPSAQASLTVPGGDAGESDGSPRPRGQ